MLLSRSSPRDLPSLFHSSPPRRAAEGRHREGQNHFNGNELLGPRKRLLFKPLPPREDGLCLCEFFHQLPNDHRSIFTRCPATLRFGMRLNGPLDRFAIPPPWVSLCYGLHRDQTRILTWVAVCSSNRIAVKTSLPG